MLDRTVHVEDRLLHRAALADWIHPLAGHCYHGGEVIRMGQYFGLEPVDLTGGSSLLARSPTADDVAHHRIDAQSFGVIHIFVARQPAVDRLTQEGFARVRYPRFSSRGRSRATTAPPARP